MLLVEVKCGKNCFVQRQFESKFPVRRDHNIITDWRLSMHCYLMFSRAQGRVLVFQYRKAPFSAEGEKDRDAGIKAIAAQNKVIL